MAETNTNQRDYISGLPDELLHDILSLLPSIERAIRTSVLSKRWEHVWTHVPNFIFRCHDVSNQNMAACLNRTLTLYSPHKLQKFFLLDLSIMDARLLSSRLEPWLSSAENLFLVFSPQEGELYVYEDGYFLSQSVYQNHRLLNLATDHCQFVPNGRISWKMLKYLSISYATLSDELIENILQGTPMLQNLKLYSCEGFQRIDLSLNMHLKMMLMEGYNAYNEPQLCISGPYLQELEILGSWFDMKCKLMNMPYLVRATLAFKISEISGYLSRFVDYQNMVRDLVNDVRHVETLKLGDWLMQILSTLTTFNDLPSALSLSTNRRCLIIGIDGFDDLSMPAIDILLLSSHKLEKLVINYEECSVAIKAGEVDYWLGNFNCLEFHLKSIEICGFGVSELYDSLGFEYLKYLLRSAKVVERMAIHDLIQSSNDNLEVAKGLLNYPRASPSAVILLEE